MEANKSLVSILMAVYKPNENWLIEQLKSLDKQTYSNLELIVCDDCPEMRADKEIFCKYVKNFPYNIIYNEENLGSNKTFEKLTKIGKGKYFAYCDQDDIWHTDKIERMVVDIESNGAQMVYSDLAVIDSDGCYIADSITKIRKRHIFYEGEGLAGKLLIRNFVTGCAMMVRADIAKQAIPFADSLVHDQWLAINAAMKGRIDFIRQPLIDYRQHENNQTAILKNVYDKNSYYIERLIKYKDRIKEYKSRIYTEELKMLIDKLEKFYNARIRYFNKIRFSDLKIMIKYRDIAPDSVLLELAIHFIPDFIFKKILQLAKRGKI